MVRRVLLVGLASGLLLGSFGCRHCCRRSNIGYARDSVRPRGTLEDPSLPRGVLIPAPRLPTNPDALPAPTLPDRSNSFSPGLPERSRGPQLLLPDPLPGGTSSRGRLLDEPLEPKSESTKAPAAVRTASAGSVPGVADFATVQDGYANGRKPSIEGFESLAARGYRTLIYLHAPSADVAPVRDMATRNKLAFVPVAVSPDTLKAGFTRFAETLAEKESRPAFVCDDDGTKTGPVWYLHFRTTVGLADDAARVRATALGLRDGTDVETTRYSVAIQDYLATR